MEELIFREFLSNHLKFITHSKTWRNLDGREIVLAIWKLVFWAFSIKNSWKLTIKTLTPTTWRLEIPLKLFRHGYQWTKLLLIASFVRLMNSLDWIFLNYALNEIWWFWCKQLLQEVAAIFIMLHQENTLENTIKFQFKKQLRCFESLLSEFNARQSCRDIMEVELRSFMSKVPLFFHCNFIRGILLYHSNYVKRSHSWHDKVFPATLCNSIWKLVTKLNFRCDEVFWLFCD